MLVYCVIVFIKQLMMLDVTNSQMQTSPAVAVLVVMLSVTAAKPGQLEVVVLGAGEECEGGVELGAGDGARYCVIRAEHWGRGRAGAGPDTGKHQYPPLHYPASSHPHRAWPTLNLVLFCQVKPCLLMRKMNFLASGKC